MSFSTRIELHCDTTGCKHAPLVAEGNEAKRFDLFKEAKSKGWQWVSAEEVYCPDHRKVAARSAKGEGKAKGKPNGKGKGAKAAPKGKTSKAKNTPLSTSGNTGMKAKSAKTIQ